MPWPKPPSDRVRRAHTVHPQTPVRGSSGPPGAIKALRGSFTFEQTREDNYRSQPAQGGGALWDVGCYPVSFMRMLAGAEPLEVFGWQATGPTGIDETFVGQLRFPGDVFAQFDCSFVQPFHAFMEIVGSEAALIVPAPFKPGESTKIFITRDGKAQTVKVKGQYLYTGEVEDMADAILYNPRVAWQIAREHCSHPALLNPRGSGNGERPEKPVLSSSRRGAESRAGPASQERPRGTW
jgi:predicted dehydrogenase